MQSLLTHDIWPEIKKRSRKARRTLAALAYVTSDKNLFLKRGDLLVVDASDAAIRCGETTASVLKHLHQKGVSLKSCPRLHAKIIVMDRFAVIGSANASKSSEKLFEASLLTDVPVTVSQAKSVIHQYAKLSRSLEEKDLARLAAIKVIRRPRSHGTTRGKVSAPGKSFWVVSATDLPEDAYPDEEKYVKRAEERIAEEHEDAEPSWLRFTGRSRFCQSAQSGDIVVVMRHRDDEQRPREVSAPSTILYRQNGKNWTRFYYDPNLESSLRSPRWKTFKKVLAEAGVRTRVTPDSVLALPTSEAIRIWDAWPRAKM